MLSVKTVPPRPRRKPAISLWAIAVLIVAALLLTDHMGFPWTLKVLASSALESPLVAGAFLMLYIALLVMPFVPGAEIGLLLLAVFGARMAVPVYLATVSALMLAFLIGRYVSGSTYSALLTSLGADLSAGPRCHEVRGKASHRWMAGIFRHRGLALIILINTPGNIVLGGGGGIALAAGISRLFTAQAFLLNISIAVAPVPLAFLLAEMFDLMGTVEGVLLSTVQALVQQELLD